MHSLGDVMTYVNISGNSPFRNWYSHELDLDMQALVREAITNQLVARGRSLEDTLWLKSVYPDLYQLRIKKSLKPSRVRILLRIYLCFEDNDEIVLLSGYNKGINTSREIQSGEIERAINLLNDWRNGNGRIENAEFLFS